MRTGAEAYRANTLSGHRWLSPPAACEVITTVPQSPVAAVVGTVTVAVNVVPWVTVVVRRWTCGRKAPNVAVDNDRDGTGALDQAVIAYTSGAPGVADWIAAGADATSS